MIYCPLGKCLFRQLWIWGTVRWGNVYGKLSVGENSVGKMPVGELSRYQKQTESYRLTEQTA